MINNHVEQKHWCERFIEFLILFLVLVSLVYGTFHSSFTLKIDKESVTARALERCIFYSTGMEMQLPPKQARVELLMCSEIRASTGMNGCDDRDPDTKMWYVVTDGSWFEYGPALENREDPSPLHFVSCHALADGRNGQIIEVGYHE